MKIKTKIQQLRKVVPHASKYGQLYKDRKQTSMRFRRVTLWTLFISDDGEHMLRPHVFEKREPHSADWWHAWFSSHLREIHSEGILPGLAIRTDLSKQWGVKQILGWIGNAKYASRDSAVRSGRNKTQPKRRPRG